MLGRDAIAAGGWKLAGRKLLRRILGGRVLIGRVLLIIRVLRVRLAVGIGLVIRILGIWLAVRIGLVIWVLRIWLAVGIIGIAGTVWIVAPRSRHQGRKHGNRRSHAAHMIAMAMATERPIRETGKRIQDQAGHQIGRTKFEALPLLANLGHRPIKHPSGGFGALMLIGPCGQGIRAFPGHVIIVIAEAIQ